MGWERKRGKLEELNRLLLDGGVEDFPVREGDTEALAGTRYVVTLDADTRLPQAAVARLVGTLAHPLNRPIFGEATGRIRSGYSIVQPRVEISPDSGNRSLFSRLFTGDTAIDIYSRAVSDVYQDLFGEGIFVGKGIYDVAAFHRSVDGRVPDNAILSHDLFEGILGRAGLATDIVLYESFPRTYPEYLRRWHRWVRGDWQLLPWLFPRVPAAAGRRIPNRFSAVDRWKIFDNLRRSLVPPGLVAFALSGWFLLPGTPWLWTLLAMLAPAGHIFTDLVTGFARGRRRGSIIGLGGRVADQTGRLFLALTFLPREASTALHAVGAVLWRSTVTRSGLLEWTTAASLAGVGAGRGRATTWREMWHGPAFALAVAVGLALTSPAALPAAGPLLILWWLSPEIALRIARPRRLDAVPPSRNDTLFLRKLGRRTWLYFETFAGPEDNWLPPDNYQEEPFEEIAHRTSPTNIGMMLVASTVALDRGWIGDREFAARTAAAFEALERLERHRGHFLNWYDTQTLAPLEPHYVSTVDSGNLAFCLLVLAAACEERADVTSESQDRRWQGLQDAVLLLAEPTSAVAPAPADPLRQLVSDIQATIVSVLERSGSSNAAAADIADRLCPAIEGRLVSAADGASLAALREAAVWLDRVRHQAEAMRRSERGQEEEVEWRETLKALARRARDWAYGMDFAPLYDRERRLFHIGHNLSAERLDPHHYDLLASEARLASYFAIAKGDVPAEHWFHLGRPLTREGGAAVLLSWNGSMFEYLMPPLFLPSGPETLLAESERAAVELQRRHGKAAGTPWGVSESAYAERDPHQRYRYRAFGVPGLGLKRGLEEDSVVAPYASALALPIAPGAAMANLRALWESGAGGVYGLYEAVDYTPGRAVPRSAEPVRAFMAHHQGMILAAIGNLLDGSVIERVRRDGRIRVADLLLSERVPREIPPEIERFPVRESGGAAPTGPAPGPWTPATGADFPQVHMLGNGRLASWVSGSGGGGLYWRGHAVTRFAPDATCDGDGLWIYVADEVSGGLWSAARQPVRAEADDYRITFHPHCAEIQRRDNGIALRTEIAVAPSEDVEFRRVTIVNETNAPRRLRLTSYGEVVLAPPGADERHPAFSKLFVGAEHRPELNGLLFHRRSRTPGEASPVLVHRLVAGPGVDLTGWEADRRAFLGRGGSVRAPKGLAEGLGGSDGWTLDPIFALQARAELAPFGTCELCFVTAAAGSSESVLDLIERYSSLPAVEWAFSDGAAAAAREVQALGLAPARLPELQQLASLLLHPHPALRAPSETLTANTAGQEQLWSVGISGDLPILLVSAAETAGADETLLGDLVRAMRLWINRGFAVDLVVLGTAASSYAEPAREAVFDLVSRLGAGELIGRRGGIHVVAAQRIQTVNGRTAQFAFALGDGAQQQRHARGVSNR
ncbi:MAG: glucoamylase family protein [Allosphingosinicella sp.]